jgi:hypothetical protein
VAEGPPRARLYRRVLTGDGATLAAPAVSIPTHRCCRVQAMSQCVVENGFALVYVRGTETETGW